VSDGPEMITAEEYRALVEKMGRRNKYNAQPTLYRGIVYDSALEADCAAELDRLAATDPPLVLRVLRQRPMRLNRTGTVKIVVDFSVVIAGHRGSVELDAKGYDTPVGKIKRAWYMDAYGVPVHVVRTPAEIEPLLRDLGCG
jgi:hypothetical protein